VERRRQKPVAAVESSACGRGNVVGLTSIVRFSAPTLSHITLGMCLAVEFTCGLRLGEFQYHRYSGVT